MNTRKLPLLLLMLFSMHSYASYFPEELQRGMSDLEMGFENTLYIEASNKVIMQQDKLKQFYEQSKSVAVKSPEYDYIEKKVIAIADFEKAFGSITKTYILVYPKYSEMRLIGNTGYQEVIDFVVEERQLKSVAIYKGFCGSEYTATLTLGKWPDPSVPNYYPIALEQIVVSQKVEPEPLKDPDLWAVDPPAKYVQVERPFPVVIETDKTSYPTRLGKAITLYWPTAENREAIQSTLVFDKGNWKLFSLWGAGSELQNFDYLEASNLDECKC